MKNNLIHGPIVPSLFRLAIPIIGMSFVQMAYNMVDMIWLGRVGASAVAAAGTAGFFTWLGQSLHFTTKIGAEISVAQAVGRGNREQAASYAGNALMIGLIMTLIYGAVIWSLAPELISFFQLEEQNVNTMAITYLQVIAIGAPFFFLNPTFAGIFTGAGNTRLPFKVTSVGLMMNIIIDPLFIFGWGPIPAMGVKGAALATILSQMCVTTLFLAAIYKGYSVMPFSLSALKLRLFRDNCG